MNFKKVKIENDEGEVLHIFDSVKEAASFYGIRPEAMAYRAKTKYSRDGETVSFLETNRRCNGKRRRRSYKEDEDFVFDVKKHCKVSYVVVMKHVCITPCPYSSSPKPFVGSSLCMDCSHFKRRDKENNVVFCTGHRFLN